MAQDVSDRQGVWEGISKMDYRWQTVGCCKPRPLFKDGRSQFRSSLDYDNLDD